MHTLFRLYHTGRTARFTWLLLLFFWGIPARPQLLKRLNSISYNVNEGLLQSHVADMAEDGNGFVWLSTGSGIQRFDGRRFHQVQTGPGPRMLPEDKYAHFFRLKNGNLWITHSKGINEYDIYTNSFKKIYGFGDTISQPARQVYAVLEEEQAVWCIGPSGLVAVSKNDQHITDSIPFTPMSGLSLASLLSPMQNFFVPAGKNICIFLYPGEIRVINTTQRTIRSFTADKEQSYFYAIEKLNDDTLAVASVRGIEKMSIADGRFSFTGPYIVSPEKNHQRFPVHLHLLQNNLMVVSFSEDLYELDMRSGRYTTHLVNLQNRSFLNNGYINGVSSDRFHNIWLVTVSDGVKKINYNFSGFRYFGTPEAKNNFAKSIFVDKTSNQIFCGTFNSGLYIFDTAQQLLKHIDAFPGSTPPYTVGGVEKTGAHEYRVYLVGSRDIYTLNTGNYSLKKLEFPPSDRSIPLNLDYYLSLLRPHDSITYLSSGFYLFEVSQHGDFISLASLLKLPQSAVCAYADPGGRIWTGAPGYYFLWEGKGHEPRSFSLPGKLLCRCFWSDRTGRVWLGTEKGLYRLDHEGKIQAVLHKSDGLPDDCIYSIREDREGNLWLSHNKGITCMSPNGAMLHFNRNDGLQENEFNTNTSWETPDGELYFGGVNGVSSFFPQVVRNMAETPNVLLSGIRINDEDWKEDTAYWSLQKLQLPWYNNTVSLEFTALGQRNPDQYMYQYRLEGVDRDWINAGDHADARYVLSPGRYVFRYHAGNGFDRRPSRYKELIIVIEPPFWKTWWFIALVLLVAVGLLFYSIHLYNEKARARLNRELETRVRIQQERDRISRELHDNIGSQLSFISSSIDWITSPPGEMSKEEELKRLANINDTAKLVISDLRETIWALKKEAIPLDELADRLKLFIRMQRTLQPQMEMVINDETHQGAISFSPTEALNIFRICQEAIVNCIKHSGAQKLEVSIRSGPGKAYTIIIHDNGQGFTAARNRGEHYGLENMQHRAAELGAVLLIDSRKGEGTTLTLRNK
ncbi:MAG: hypothetical protein JST39_01755 [Bacteroidetes bacterium]|nr:hypothetical protein [Bacteroidota bacterium]